MRPDELTTPEWEAIKEAVDPTQWGIAAEKQKQEDRLSALWDARLLLAPYFPDSPESRRAKPLACDLINLADFIVREAQTFNEEPILAVSLQTGKGRCTSCGQTLLT